MYVFRKSFFPFSERLRGTLLAQFNSASPIMVKGGKLMEIRRSKGPMDNVSKIFNVELWIAIYLVLICSD